MTERTTYRVVYWNKRREGFYQKEFINRSEAYEYAQLRANENEHEAEVHETTYYGGVAGCVIRSVRPRY